MSVEEDIVYLKKVFADRFPYATLTVTKRTVKGKLRYYFKTKGAYKVDSGRLIECCIDLPIHRYKQDLSTLTYHYKTD
jgi:hypothetical protein